MSVGSAAASRRWPKAFQAVNAPSVYIRETHERALQIIELNILKKSARDLS